MEPDLRITVLAQDWEDAQEQIQRANARIVELEADAKDLFELNRGLVQAELDATAAANARAEAAEKQLSISADTAIGAIREAAALRAEVERVKVLARATAAAADVFRNRLVAARELLADIVDVHGDFINLDGVRIFLDSANPESPRAPIARHPVRHIPEDQLVPVESSRAAAERAVLEAMARVSECALDVLADDPTDQDELSAVAKAELARRQTKR